MTVHGKARVNAPSGTVDCLRRAWEAHEGEILGFLQHRLGVRDVAEDVLHDVFVKSMLQGT